MWFFTYYENAALNITVKLAFYKENFKSYSLMPDLDGL